MTKSVVTIVSEFDGTEIPVIITHPVNSCRWILMIHGLGTSKNEYLDFYRSIADKLAESGVSSLRFDCRGHGDSKASGREFNILNNVKDSLSCLNKLHQRFPDAIIDILGTSFGAPTALCTAKLLPDRIKHIYLIAPALDFEQLYLKPIPERVDRYSDFMKRVIERNEIIAIDDRIAFAAQNAIEFGLIDIPEIVRKVQRRLTVIHGDADSMIPVRITQNVLSNAREAKLHILRNMDHGFMHIGDENGLSLESQTNLRQMVEILLNEQNE